MNRGGVPSSLTKTEFSKAIFDEDTECWTVKVKEHKNSRLGDLQVVIPKEDMPLLRQFDRLRWKMDITCTAAPAPL